MSITLKRPMFRKGGEVKEGIMELATPRRNYKEGKTREEMIQEIFETSGLTDSGKSYAETAMKLANLGQPSGGDLLTNVLIQGGLRGMSTAGKGGTLANLASAFEAPVGQALKARTAGKQMGLAGAMKGLELGIKKDIADRAVDAKFKTKQFESGTSASRIKQMIDLFGGDTINANDRYKAAQLAKDEDRAQQALGPIFRGVAPVDASKTKIDLTYLASQDDNTIHLNPYTRKFVIKKSEPLRTEPIDQITLKEITEE